MRPKTRTELVVDRIHGTPVEDPYRWLEETDSEEVKAWVDAQNLRTRKFLDALPGRDALRPVIAANLAVGTIGTPVMRGDWIFHERRDGTENQPILYVRQGFSGDDRVLLDINLLAEDGTVALDWWYPSRDGRLVAYGLSTEGSELSVLSIRRVEDGVDLPDRIPNTRACSLAWQPGSGGFFYTRYPGPGSVPEGQEMYNRRVFHHKLGDPPDRDAPVFGEGREPDAWPNVTLSRNGRWLAVTESKGWVKTQVYLKDLAADRPFVPVVEGKEALHEVVLQDDRILIHTNDGASRWRLYAARPEAPGRESWQELIPPGEDVLQGVEPAGGKLFALYLRQASSSLRVFSEAGEFEKEIELPSIGTVYGLDGEPDRNELFFGFVSFTMPPAVFLYQIESGSARLWKKILSPVEPSEFTIDQVRYTSKDGTSIPMFLVGRNGRPRDGSNPVLLTGYGGFNVSLTPTFGRENFAWLDRGGIVAIPNLRGGGEFGEEWHRDGMLDRKQNVFDDFIAAAEHLIEHGYTRPERLVILGGSNGGLLVGAALTQRPDLFKAVVCAVPLLDMIRYHKFRIARLWIPEYGSSEEPEQFNWLMAYSPYHKVSDGTPYPAVLLTTGVSDSRVDPMHALKMTARLQKAQPEGGPEILLRVETKAGHGAGKPLALRIEAQIDLWSFLMNEVGLLD